MSSFPSPLGGGWPTVGPTVRSTIRSRPRPPSRVPFYFFHWDKHAIGRLTGEVADAVLGTVILSLWSIQLHATPHTISKLRTTVIAERPVFLLLVLTGEKCNPLSHVSAGDNIGPLYLTSAVLRITSSLLRNRKYPHSTTCGPLHTHLFFELHQVRLTRPFSRIDRFYARGCTSSSRNETSASGNCASSVPLLQNRRSKHDQEAK